MKRSDFKFTTKFETKANVSLGNFQKINESEGLLAKASLDDLRQLLPDEETIEENPDLLYTSFNAAVINLINANDHGMATDTALAIAKYFKDRHMNIEHNRFQVIGHIMNYGFSTFGGNKMVDAASLEGSQEPFNLCLAAIVYKVVDEFIAEIIEDSANPKSYNYKEISASWEIGYNEYDIVLGSKKLKDAEIVTDEARKKECDAFLRMNGGPGFLEDGTPVYALIKGSDARPLGCAFTFSPAAAVEGLVTASEDDPAVVVTANTESVEISQEFVTPEEVEEKISQAKKDVLDTVSKENKEKNQQKSKNTVIRNMKINRIEDITTDFLKEAEASHITDFIREKLNEAGDKFKADLEQAQEEKKQIADSLKEIEDKKKELEDEVQSLNEKVTNLEDAIAAKAKEETYNQRLGEITEAYDLSEEQVKAVANQIRDLTDEDYESWKGQFDLFAKKKEEGSKPDKAQEAAAALENVEVEATVLPNSQGGEKDEMAEVIESFKDNLKITTR